MRRRYVHRPGHPKANDMGMVDATELGHDDRPAENERQPVFTDRYMEGARSPIDGSDIGSRRKREEHMKSRGLVDAGDFMGEWAKARAAREEFRRTGDDGKDWGARLAETYERMQRGRR